jgi:hypothetical protein
MRWESEALAIARLFFVLLLANRLQFGLDILSSLIDGNHMQSLEERHDAKRDLPRMRC